MSVQCLNFPVSTNSLQQLDKILVTLVSAFIFLYILFLYNFLQKVNFFNFWKINNSYLYMWRE